MNSNNNNLESEIKIFQTKLQVETDPKQKKEIQKKLMKLQLEKEIEEIKRRIDYLK